MSSIFYRTGEKHALKYRHNVVVLFRKKTGHSWPNTVNKIKRQKLIVELLQASEFPCLIRGE